MSQCSCTELTLALLSPGCETPPGFVVDPLMCDFAAPNTLSALRIYILLNGGEFIVVIALIAEDRVLQAKIHHTP